MLYVVAQIVSMFQGIEKKVIKGRIKDHPGIVRKLSLEQKSHKLDGGFV